MPSASRDDKLWPEADWQKVFARLHEHDLDLKLLSGSPAETERARQLVAGNPRAQVLPRMNLTEVARVLAGARMMVGLDSGLTHLSAGLRSEERRVGKECVSTCRSRWEAEHVKKKKRNKK